MNQRPGDGYPGPPITEELSKIKLPKEPAMPSMRRSQRRVAVDPATASPVEMLQDVLLSSFATLDVTQVWPDGTVRVRGCLALDSDDGLSPAEVRRALFERAESVIHLVTADLGYEHDEHPRFEITGELVWQVAHGQRALMARAELELILRPSRETP